MASKRAKTGQRIRSSLLTLNHVLSYTNSFGNELFFAKGIICPLHHQIDENLSEALFNSKEPENSIASSLSRTGNRP